MKRLRALPGPLLVALTGGAMLIWTWGAWPDPLVDFGRELYVPWRLSQGAALYSDIAWFNGPLSQYWHGFLFRLLGPGLSVIVWSNLAVLALVVWAVHSLIGRVAGRLAAVVACMVLLLVFAFGQYVGVGNYNWVTPYSHELTHGIALALAALAALDRWARTGSTASLGLGGLALGLCSLTKVEPFLAGVAGSAVLLASSPRRLPWRSFGLLVGLGILPGAVSLALLGWDGTAAAWRSALDLDVARLRFYVVGLGMDEPGLRLQEVVAWSAMWLLVLAPPAATGWLARGTRWPALPWAAGAVTLLAMARIGDRYAWGEAVRPLALFALVAITLMARSLALRGRDPRTALALALSVFSFVLLLKMILNVRIAHYGFALAMPATLLAVTVLVSWVPEWLGRKGGRADVLRACVLALVAVFAVRHVGVTGTWLDGKSSWVGAGRDAFRADERGELVTHSVEFVRSSGARTLSVLPEGVMINYLARVPSPTPYVTFLPPEAALFGDEEWTDGFRAAPPDLVLLVPRDVSEYGRGPFGSGYGRSLSDWLEAEYVASGEVPGRGRLTARVLVPRSRAGEPSSGASTRSPGGPL